MKSARSRKRAHDARTARKIASKSAAAKRWGRVISRVTARLVAQAFIQMAERSRAFGRAMNGFAVAAKQQDAC